MGHKVTRRLFLGAGAAAGALARGIMPGRSSGQGEEVSDTPVPSKRVSNSPNIEDYATIEAYANGVPVYSFGNVAYVYGVSPDLFPGAVMQEGNTQPAVKIKPKK